jgi:hypothetical protein
MGTGLDVTTRCATSLYRRCGRASRRPRADEISSPPRLPASGASLLGDDRVRAAEVRRVRNEHRWRIATGCALTPADAWSRRGPGASPTPLAAGYEDLSFFRTLFKRRTGSPSRA